MRLTAAVTLVALTSLTIGTTGAAADPPGLTTPVAAPAATPEAEPASDYLDSYRGQTLGADGIAVGLVVVAGIASSGTGRTNSTSLLELALATYLIGGPLVHLLHDRPGRAAASLALRVGVPFAFALAGSYISSSRDSGCSPDVCDDESALPGAALGALVGVVTASVLDAVLLAKGDERPGSAHLVAAPIRGGGMTFGLAGHF